MTIFFPDVSEYDRTVSLKGAPVAIARATISNVTDARYDWYVQNAKVNGVPLVAYHFLNSPSLGVSVADQAAYAHSVIGSAPTMLDVETNRQYSATLSDAINWVNTYRKLGGVCNLAYIPHWYWQQWGSPSMAGLASLGVNLVSSNYTTYSDTGPGWTGYGGMTPVQWQYTDAGSFNGAKVDMNAYKGTAEEYWAMVTGGMRMSSGITVPATGNRDLETCVSDLWNEEMQGHSGFVSTDVSPRQQQLNRIENTIKNISNVQGGLTDADRQAIKDLTDAVNALNSRLASP